MPDTKNPPFGPMDPRSPGQKLSTLPGWLGKENYNTLSDLTGAPEMTDRESWLGKREAVSADHERGTPPPDRQGAPSKAPDHGPTE